MYNKISESINHIREEITITELNSIINEIFYFDLVDNEKQKASLLFDDISKEYLDMDIKVKTGFGDIVSVSIDDVCIVFGQLYKKCYYLYGCARLHKINSVSVC